MILIASNSSVQAVPLPSTTDLIVSSCPYTMQMEAALFLNYFACKLAPVDPLAWQKFYSDLRVVLAHLYIGSERADATQLHDTVERGIRQWSSAGCVNRWTDRIKVTTLWKPLPLSIASTRQQFTATTLRSCSQTWTPRG